MNVADARNGDAGKHVEAQGAGQAQHGDEHGGAREGALAVETPFLHGEGDEVLEDGDDGGERREAHEHEKQRAPQLPQRHLVEHVGQRDEHERGALIGGDGEGEACGEDDEAREDGHGGVQAADAQGLARERVLLADTAAEDLHGRDAERQREERLAHGRIHRVPETGQAAGEHLAEVGYQVELQARVGAGQRDGAHHEQRHDAEQGDHHHFRDTLDALLQAQAADEKADDHHGEHPAHHLGGVGEHGAEDASDAIGIESDEGARGHFRHVSEHPAADGGVEHHE